LPAGGAAGAPTDGRCRLRARLGAPDRAGAEDQPGGGAVGPAGPPPGGCPHPEPVEGRYPGSPGALTGRGDAFRVPLHG